MEVEKKVLPTSAVERLMKKGGVSRASRDALEELKSVLETIGDEVSKKAWKLSTFAGRKTVKAEDVRLALQW